MECVATPRKLVIPALVVWLPLQQQLEHLFLRCAHKQLVTLELPMLAATLLLIAALLPVPFLAAVLNMQTKLQVAANRTVFALAFMLLINSVVENTTITITFAPVTKHVAVVPWELDRAVPLAKRVVLQKPPLYVVLQERHVATEFAKQKPKVRRVIAQLHTQALVQDKLLPFLDNLL